MATTLDMMPGSGRRTEGACATDFVLAQRQTAVWSTTWTDGRRISLLCSIPKRKLWWLIAVHANRGRGCADFLLACAYCS